MSDLVERLKYIFRGFPAKSISSEQEQTIQEAITALSFVLPDDVARVLGNVRNAIFNAEKREAVITAEALQEAADLLERQAREIKRKELIILALKARVANWDEMAERIEQLMVFEKDADHYRKLVAVQAERIKELESSNKDKAQLLASFRSQIQALEEENSDVKQHSLQVEKINGRLLLEKAALQENE